MIYLRYENGLKGVFKKSLPEEPLGVPGFCFGFGKFLISLSDEEESLWRRRN
jgi:hypothetical protein